MFYAAQALLEREGLAFSKHSAVIAAFGKHLAQTGRVPAILHRYLIDAEKSRLQGDYDPADIVSESAAAVHISRAEVFLEIAERLLGPPHEDEPGKNA
jgi:uncharacterized protein (UPF0332 family)